MKPSSIFIIIVAVFTGLVFSSCKKYLDKQPDKALIVPEKVADLQTLLDNYTIMNKFYTDLSEAIAADFYFRDPTLWSVKLAGSRLSYVWDANADFLQEWQNVPQIYYIANVVLEELPKLPVASSQTEFNNVKGQALFFRSFAFYHLAQLYCRPYSSTASTDLGLPLRLSPDFNIPSVRSTVAQTYDQILSDFKEAVRLLPVTPVSPTRPGRAAAYGAIARTYLSMRDYVNAGKYADSCLQLSHSLMDYNTLDPSSSQPVPNLNPEVIFWNLQEIGSNNVENINMVVDSLLYKSYADDDLRKQIFYQINADGTHGFKGSYSYQESFTIFNGIATDEMYLIRAEAYARAGNKDDALSDLNTVLSKRWKNTVTYPVITATDAAGALDKILMERRKELVARGLRWMDLRRLNLEGANITLKRVIYGVTYTLPPNDLRWVLLFPTFVTSLSPIQQNPR